MPNRLTMAEMRTRIARRLRDHWGGVLAENVNALSDEVTVVRPERDNFFANGWFRTGLDDEAEEFIISSSQAWPATPVLTVAGNFTRTHASELPYEVHRLLSAEEYNSFILDAILDAGTTQVLANLEYADLTWASETWEYSLPANFRYISAVRIEPAGQENIWVRDQVQSLAVLPGIPRKLMFPQTQTYPVGSVIRIYGQGPEQEPTDLDTDLIQTDASFIMAHALLSARMILGDGEGDLAASSRQMVPRMQIDLELKREAMIRTGARPLPGSLVLP